MYSTVPWAKCEDLLSKPYLLPLHSHRTIYLLDPSLSARVRRRQREREMCVRFSSVQEILFLHSSPPWGPPSYLCSAHSDRTCILEGAQSTWCIYSYTHCHTLSNTVETVSPCLLFTRAHTHYIGAAFLSNAAHGVTCTLSLWKRNEECCHCMLVVALRRVPSKALYEECLRKHKTVFNGDERPTDSTQTPLSCALQYLPCAGATQVGIGGVEYVVTAVTVVVWVL